MQGNVCQQVGHEGFKSLQICTFQGCNSNLWVCAQCLLDRIHLHDQQNQDHIMNQEQFQKYFVLQTKHLQVQDQIQSHFVLECLEKVEEITKSLKKLSSQIELDYDNNISMKQIRSIKQKISTEFLSLDREYFHQINNLFQPQHATYDYKLSINLLDEILKESLSLKDFLNYSENYQIQQEIKPIDQENVQPQIQQQQQQDHQMAQKIQLIIQEQQQEEESQVKQKNKTKNRNSQIKYYQYFEYSPQKNKVNTADISPNLKYLAFGGNDNQISIVELESKKLLETKKLGGRAEICKFSQDSSLLLCGDHEGYLHIFDGQKNFILNFKHKISVESIIDIIFINKDTILHHSQKNKIVKTNIKQNLIILEIDTICNNINSIDYEQEKYLVCCCSEQNDIKVFNVQNGEMIISQTQSHTSNVRLKQIQFVNQSDNIVSANQQELILWQMDYKNKQLIKINQISDYKITNFSCVNNGKRIIIVSEKNLLYILNNQLMLNQTVQFKCTRLCSNYQNYYKQKSKIFPLDSALTHLFNNYQQAMLCKQDSKYTTNSSECIDPGFFF